MKKVFGFVIAVSCMFICTGVVSMASTNMDSVNVGGGTIMAAYATNGSGYWAASVQVANGCIDVQGNLKYGWQIKNYHQLIDDDNPVSKSGGGNKNLVSAYGKSYTYEVSVSNP